MVRFFLVFLIISIFSACKKKAELPSVTKVVIEGKVKELDKAGDSIFFTPGLLEKDLYDQPLLADKVDGRTFSLKGEFLYPQMYYVNFESEKNEIPMRGGVYFLDQQSRDIIVDSLRAGECSTLAGPTQDEYQNQFIPFFIEDYNCSTTSFSYFIYQNPSLFDIALLKYVNSYSDSYVALWFLIRQIQAEGHKPIFEKILGAFSTQVKEGGLWQKVSKDFNNIRIKKEEDFPALDIKTLSLEETEFKLPSGAQFTLVDYWFSTCKPCLETFPKLKELYDSYHSSGFELHHKLNMI